MLTCERLIKYDLVESVENDLDKEMFYKFINILGEIYNLDSFIRDSPSFPRSTDKIIRNELISVIGATLSIEGTILEKEEIEEGIKKAGEGQQLRRKEQEAENSRKVYKFLKDFFRDNIKGFEYSEPLIKQIHTYFTDSIDYVSNVPGVYRTNFNVSFGDPRKDCLCKTQSEIELAMKNYIDWLNIKENGPLSGDQFVKAIMAHYYLTEIHPFADGNGRTARAIEALVLYAHRVNDYCFWSLANFWSSHKDQYLHHLHEIRQTLNPINFVLWGLEGYRDEIKSIKEKVLKKVKELMLSDYIQYKLRNKTNEKVKINKRIVDIMQLLILWERIPLKKFLSSPEVTALYSRRSYSTRARDIQKMEQLNLIRREEIDNEFFIEPNYRLLEYLEYEVLGNL